MQIISIVNKKGGVAKTTTALALASDLSKRNFHVLAIDCDAQANFSKASGGEDNVVGSFDILTGKENINETIQELPLYHLIGADKRLSSLDVALNKREFAGIYANMYNQRLIQCPAHGPAHGSVEKCLK